MDKIQPQICDKAEDLLNDLQLRKECWRTDDERLSSWVFRGQRCKDWQLLPGAWRSGDNGKAAAQMVDRFKAKLDKQGIDYFRSQCEKNFNDAYSWLLKQSDKEPRFDGWEGYLDWCKSHNENDAHNVEDRVLSALLLTFAEVDTIWEFIGTGDRIGHRIASQEAFKPWGSVLWRSAIYLLHPQPDDIIAPFPLWDGRNHVAVGLAQHHGIPTALLDWTFNPFYAALFATEGVEPGDSDGHVFVWALDSSILRNDRTDFPGKSPRFQKITIPRSENLYLHAQDSLFTYDTRSDSHFITNGRRLDLEEALIESFGLEKTKLYLRKFALPTKEVGSLIRSLWSEGVSMAHLKPAWDGVTESLKTMWRWEMHGDDDQP